MNIIRRLIVISVFIAILTFVITYARGYRLDFQKKSVTSTGILAISSTPKAAKIYLNGALAGATDSNLTLPPGFYEVAIAKDGYTSWRKKVTLKGEWVLTLEALLFPANPTLSPLTNLGVVKAIPLDQSEKILLLRQNNDLEKDGIYLFEASKKSLPFLTPLKLLLLKKNLPANLDFNQAEVTTSSDYKQAIIQFPISNFQSPISNPSYLLSLEEENKTPFDVTASKETLLEAWAKEKESQNLKILETFPPGLTKIATDSFHIIAFSPNETKILYQAKKSLTLPPIIIPPLIATNQTKEERTLKKDQLYVYDKKEDKNFVISIPASSLQLPASILWLPDSKHLASLENKKISVVDYDGTNKQTVYSGPLAGSFFSASADGIIIVLANLNPETNPWPDLYAVGIR